jgi:acyl carrier protein
MASRDEVFATVKGIIVDRLEVDEEEVSGGAKISELVADSLDMVDLIQALEEELDADIPDEDIEKIITVDNAVDYVLEKKG